MTQATRSIADTLDEHVTTGLYAAIALACVAFAGMLLAPVEHAEWLLWLAWICMAGAMVCLVGRLCVALLMGRPQESAAGWHTPQQ